MNLKSKLALLAAAAVMSSTAMALPARTLFDDAYTRSETVQFKAASAATLEGATALYAKLKEAAVRVCSDDKFVSADADALQSCVNEAVGTAVNRIAIPMVSVLHLQAGRTGIASR